MRAPDIPGGDELGQSLNQQQLKKPEVINTTLLQNM